jgi:hypothetical protein
VGVDLVDGAFGAVLLEIEQRLPDVGIDDGGLIERLGIVVSWPDRKRSKTW